MTLFKSLMNGQKTDKSDSYGVRADKHNETSSAALCCCELLCPVPPGGIFLSPTFHLIVPVTLQNWSQGILRASNRLTDFCNTQHRFVHRLRGSVNLGLKGGGESLKGGGESFKGGDGFEFPIDAETALKINAAVYCACRIYC